MRQYGQFWTPITPLWGSKLHAETHLLEGKSITCRFMHVTVPPKAICWVGEIDIALFLLIQGWAEVADDVTEAPYVEAVASAQSKKIGIWGDGSL